MVKALVNLPPNESFGAGEETSADKASSDEQVAPGRYPNYSTPSPALPNSGVRAPNPTLWLDLNPPQSGEQGFETPTVCIARLDKQEDGQTIRPNCSRARSTRNRLDCGLLLCQFAEYD